MLYGLVWSGRIADFHIPEGIAGILETALLCFGAMWIAIFVLRMIYYPIHLNKKIRIDSLARIDALENLVKKHDEIGYNPSSDKILLLVKHGYFRFDEPDLMFFQVRIRNPGAATSLHNWRFSARLSNFYHADAAPIVELFSLSAVNSKETFTKIENLKFPIGQGVEWWAKISVKFTEEVKNLINQQGIKFYISVEDVRERVVEAEWETRNYETRLS